MSLRICPACGKQYASSYTDAFCECGTELVGAAAAGAGSPERPAAGTRCLVLYGPEKQPLHYFALTKDVILIGRLDPVEGIFPDVDLAEMLDASTARRVSRRHALLLHSRATDVYVLRPLAGNTGTQIEADMVPAQREYPLLSGTHVILGGVVRLKFEIV
jgi:hypothetical protein